MLPIHRTKSSKVTENVFQLSEDKLCDTLQAMTPTTVKMVTIKPPYSISRATSIDSDCCRLPMASVLSNKSDE